MGSTHGAMLWRSPENMKTARTTVGRPLIGGLLFWGSVLVCAISFLSPARAQEVAELRAKAESGDAVAQVRLGEAYRKGAGVPKNEELAYKWIRKAAEQGNAQAEDDLGTIYRLGEGVARDKNEAVHWYKKAAHHGSAAGMFNLGTCYYNGDGVSSNEYTAYVWFLLAQEAGNPIASDAVNRSADTMSRIDVAEALVQIGDMYDKGEEVPRDELRAMTWLRKGAEKSYQGKVRLAFQLLKVSDGSLHYKEASELCKSAAHSYAPAQRCLGYFYRIGMGVPHDPSEAVKWYKKAADQNDPPALFELAAMYELGEGTSIDYPDAFIAYFRAGRLGVPMAYHKAISLWRRMNKEDQAKTSRQLRARSFDPDKVIAVLEALPPS